jgi:hypothetical protein
MRSASVRHRHLRGAPNTPTPSPHTSNEINNLQPLRTDPLQIDTDDTLGPKADTHPLQASFVN